MYGIQTDRTKITVKHGFENDVKMYGIQTDAIVDEASASLRMM